MFGESDSESPRVPSPWDSLTSAPASPPKQNGTQGIPKLVPEAEEGNVEYKLQLLSPTPSRFARLVTQLKWRLLEGGGQAYYELGIADCGTLVGLPRQQLEESLETLEMMAGEIGASVIVVKEIEVPPELSSLAESQLERWDGGWGTTRKDMLRMMMMKQVDQDDESPTTSATEVETELSNTDLTDVEETSCCSPTTTVDSSLGEPNFKPPLSPLPFDPALAMFTMNLGEDIADDADNEAPDDDFPTDTMAEFTVNVEISSVYKPRPMKKRMMHSTHFEYVKRRHKNGYSPSKSIDTTHTANPTAQRNSQTNGAKSQLRRDKRDKRRELKLNGLSTHVPTQRSAESPTDSPDRHAIPPASNDVPNSSLSESPPTVAIDLPTADASTAITGSSKEPRLIVEALVVRKLSLDEAFLDFGGFSLQ